MNRAAILCFIFCLSKPCQASHHASGVARRHIGAEDRYYNLLQVLDASISQHRETSNIGGRQDLANNYPGKPAEHCGDVYKAGYHDNGVYTISPPGVPSLDVYCYMIQVTNMSDAGGWTVFQKRFDGKVDFDRVWFEYKRGFGDVKGEHWLGLENIFLLTHSEPMQLFIYLEDWEGNSRWAHYGAFTVTSEFSKYRLDIGDYTGTAGDAMKKQRGYPFTTKDQDNDSYRVNCAVMFKGAWWHKKCFDSNLNGQYLNGTRKDYLGVQWRKWQDKYSFKTAIMMMKPIYDN